MASLQSNPSLTIMARTVSSNSLREHSLGAKITVMGEFQGMEFKQGMSPLLYSPSHEISVVEDLPMVLLKSVDSNL